ncbi:ThuA domain-containing protein [Nonomuraea sp. MG754425]|uniref:ThuA domain-containing protein n=1 Tax=Nonomuraea sp. MG754425 TaxID=2570319 RepID=UPI001F3867DF|nr:ThuA domain-containing protein [Nonomuraea sp. MG754425]MCF6469298.1 ThuA domain-containing protein [Nonomuraea sp. MG754425]
MPRVLFLYGGWPGHRPYEVADWATHHMDDLGMKVDAVNDPYRLEADLTAYDLIVIGWTQAHTTENLTTRQEDSLLEAVRQGTGVAGWHGMAASFRASLRYNHLVGGSCVSHPGGEGVEVPYEVTITDTAHPVTAGVGSFHVASEQYYMHLDPANHVLAETVFSGEHLPWIEGQRMPVAYVRTWGAGRVFYCSVGHYPKDLQSPQATRLLRQGLSWACRES